MVPFKGGFFLMLAFGVTASLAGCGKQATTGPPSLAAHRDHGHEGHEHGTLGPHRGELIELGDGDYHGELLHDVQASSMTMYILDGKAQALVPVAVDAVTLNLMLDGSPSGFQLTAVRTEKDPEGRASRFVLANKDVADALDREDARGQLRVMIGGKPFSGAIEHGGHVH